MQFRFLCEFSWVPEEGQKGQISFNFNYLVNFKDFFLPNFVCVLTNKRYKTYQTEFALCRLGHAPGVVLWDIWVPRGGGGGQKTSNMVMCYIKSTGMTSRTEYK